jgi:hypothetical protein
MPRSAGRNVTQPDPQLPDRSVQVIRSRAAEFSAFLGEHAADLVDPLEVAVAEAVQPLVDFRFELEVIQTPYPFAHAWSDYRADGSVRRLRDTCS